jgi:Glycosyltransferase
MPKVFNISGALNFGAPGRITEQIGLLAQQRGFEVFVAHSSRNENPSRLPHKAITTKLQEMFHALGAKFFDLHGLMSTEQTEELVKLIKKYNPDIIHLHNIHGYFLNFKVLFEYLNTVDIPVVWTMHDCWSFTGRCFHFEGAHCCKWKSGCYDCKAEKGYTVSPFYDRSKQLYELKKNLFSTISNLTMVPVSNWQADFLKDSFLKGCKVKVIHNGIDLQSFYPKDDTRLREKYNLIGKFVLLGVASPWNTRKGLDDFIRLRNLLSQDFVIVMVGLRPEQIKKLPSGIVGINRTESQEELAEYYSMADCFVNLTYLDTFPTVNIEALACGTPVLTYKTGGSPETIDDKTGIVIKQGDITSLIETVLKIKDYSFSAMDCRKRAEKYFDKNRCFEEYIELYNSLLSK